MNYEFLHKILPIVFKHEDFCYLYWSLTFLKVVAPKGAILGKTPKELPKFGSCSTRFNNGRNGFVQDMIYVFPTLSCVHLLSPELLNTIYQLLL